ncbi:pas domain s-box protein [Stylonychia lemnae]|uniref:Pas domain s-box protein n=1 Tax=Stylonychia lemnae TaxID=5949 RepID=A0A078B7J5_STYLE|nr:pas domain s-box protein [Stylonychia lemnae]|eukprot:CDW89272.1 pas domain s-box protein [Stylonychia lemnae]
MNQELTKLFDNLPEGIVLYNQEDKNIVLANHEFKRLFKVNNQQKQNTKDYEQLKNLRLYDFKSQQENILNNDMQNVFTAAEAEGQYYQVQQLKEDRRCSYLQSNETETEIVTFSKQQILFQNFYHSMIMIKNLTPMMKLEKLKVENHFYEMLTATVSHDLRTPLNSMIGLLNNMDMYINDTQGKRFLSIIKNSSSFMLFLVNDLLDCFQIKNGKFKKNMKWTDMAKSIRELIDMFSVGAREKGIKIRLEISQNFPHEIFIDEQRIKQVILNLLQNALKFTFKGQISLEASFCKINKELKISVIDTGVGISTEDQRNLFKMFGKLDATSQINTSGIGLGLSICKQIVEVFDGKIYVDDNDQPGTKFTFYVKCEDGSILLDSNNILLTERPLQNSDEEIYGLDQYLQDPTSCQNLNFSQEISFHLCKQDVLGFQPFQRKFSLFNEEQKINCECQSLNKILVVDDNIFNVVTLQTIIEQNQGFQCDKAMNGIQAVEMFKSRLQEKSRCQCFSKDKSCSYNLIFMDCSMPLLDGFEATKQIRLIEKSQPNLSYQTRIIALTAYTSDQLHQQCLESGMNKFVTKPICAKAITEIIEQYLTK